MSVGEENADVVEQHSTGQESGLRDVAAGGDAVLAELGDAPRSERLTVCESLIEDFEDVAPVLLTRGIADVAHSASVDRRDSRRRPKDEAIYVDECPEQDLQRCKVERETSPERSQSVPRLKHCSVWFSRRRLRCRSACSGTDAGRCPRS